MEFITIKFKIFRITADLEPFPADTQLQKL